MTKKPMTVVKYKNMQIQDSRDRIQVVIEGDLPLGAGAGLRHEGFRRKAANTWEAPATPQNYMAAQAIGTEFFGKETA